MATKAEMIAKLSQCGGLSYQGWIDLFDSIFFDGDLQDIIVSVPQNKVLPIPTDDFTHFALVLAGQYTQTGKPTLTVNDGNFAILKFDPATDTWSIQDQMNVKGESGQDGASLLAPWVSGYVNPETGTSGYPLNAAVVLDDEKTIVRNTAEGNTSNPNTGGAGWLQISSDNEDIQKVLSYFLLGEPTYETISTLTAQIGYLTSNNQFNAESGTNRVILNFDVSTSDFFKYDMMPVKSGNSSVVSVLGIKPDNSIDILIPNQPAGGTATVQGEIDITAYNRLSICYDNNYANTLLQVFNTRAVKDNAVQAYIDNSVKDFIKPDFYFKSNDLVLDLSLNKDFVVDIALSNTASAISVINKAFPFDNYIFTIKVNFIDTVAIGFPRSFKFAGGVVPSFLVNRTYILVCETTDMGNSWEVAVVGPFLINNTLVFNSFLNFGEKLASSDNGVNWTLPNSNDIDITEGGLILRNPLVQTSYPNINTGKQNVIIGARLKRESRSAQTLLFKFLNAQNFGLLTINNNGGITIYFFENDNVQGSAFNYPANQLPTRDYWDVRIEVMGTDYKFFIDGLQIWTINQASLAFLNTATRVGLMFPAADPIVRITNLVVTENV